MFKFDIDIKVLQLILIPGVQSGYFLLAFIVPSV